VDPDLAELYEGREASAVKHLILRRYLQKLAYKVGTFCKTLNYVEGFAGPWNAHTEELSDTSPHIAIKELIAARQGLAMAGIRGPCIRCLFCEKKPAAVSVLRESLEKYKNIRSTVVQGEFLEHIEDVRRFVEDAANPDPRFTFIFVDPTGWTKYDPEVMAPLLRRSNTEVLVNFMTKDIIRFIGHPDEKIWRTFEPLVGPTDTGRPWEGFVGPDREEVIVRAFCGRLRQIGNFEFVVTAIVLNPTRARTHFHLVYGTRSEEGLRTFRQAERASLRTQIELRELARQRLRQHQAHSHELFPAVEMGGGTDLQRLLERHHALAWEEMVANLKERGAVSFDELEVMAMKHQMVAPEDVKEWLKLLKDEGMVRYEGLAKRERVPKPNRGHRIVWL
jgi:three-Cys-motif partner protein